ncbi:MAG: hypothetical protein QOC89_2442 [Paraburkholderia sp.]|nr:hypothetical protein [Paraburkholderia sp.]MEA3129933.1 hypothetical protein [Paraburkholderia sp.]
MLINRGGTQPRMARRSSLRYEPDPFADMRHADYLTFAPTASSQCFVIVSLVASCWDNVGNTTFL